MDQGSSLLLDIDGLVVDRVVRNDAGRRIVHCSTDPQLAGWCPACGEQSRSPKAWVTTRPRDVRLGEDRPILLWRKRKWRCQVDGCERKVFHRMPARAGPRAGPDHHPRPPAGGGSDRRPHPAGVLGRGRVRHGLAHRARRVRRPRRAGVARAAAASDRAGGRRDPPRQGPLRDRPDHRGEGLGGPVRHRPGRSERQRWPVRAGQRPHQQDTNRVAAGPGSGLARQHHAHLDGHVGDVRPRRPPRPAERRRGRRPLPPRCPGQQGGHRLPAGTGLGASWPAGPQV
jgi:hypothetical protein